MIRILIIGSLVLLLPMSGIAVAFSFPGHTMNLTERLGWRMAGFHAHTVEVMGHEIRYVSGGSGAPLILLHGFGGTSANWSGIASELSEHFQLIIPDLPGYGRSSRLNDESYVVAEQIARLHAFTEALGLDRFYLGGNSMGGHIAAGYAAENEERVQGLWLIAPAGVTGGIAPEFMQHLEDGRNPLLVDSLEAFDDMLEYTFVDPPAIPRFFRRQLAKDAIDSRPFLESTSLAMLADPYPLEPKIEGLKTPALITWGNQDRVLDPRSAQTFADLLSNAEVQFIEDAGHLPMMEKPEVAGRALLEFFGKR